MCKTYDDDKIFLMRVIFTLILLLSVLNLQNVFAENLNTPDNKEVASMIQSQNIAFEDCTKMFAVNKEKLFYLTLGAISANNFSVDEIQTSNGYVIFSAANNKYLAIAEVDTSGTMIQSNIKVVSIEIWEGSASACATKVSKAAVFSFKVAIFIPNGQPTSNIDAIKRYNQLIGVNITQISLKNMFDI